MAVTQQQQEERKGRTNALVKEMSKFIKAETLFGDESFEIDLNPKRTSVRVWTGDADVKVYGSTEFHQVVLVVTENARKLVETVNVRAANSKEAQIAAIRPVSFPIAFPSDAKVTYRLLEDPVPIQGRPQGSVHSVQSWTAKVEASLEKSVFTFLTGRDEKSYFISPLRRPVRSVQGAHDELRPKGVPAGSPRVGEFFFVPASQTLSEKLDRQAKVAEPVDLEPDSNHYAPIALFSTPKGTTRMYWGTRRDEDLYVCGFVLDAEDRHSPFWLPDWHKVVRNNEDIELGDRFNDGGRFD